MTAPLTRYEEGAYSVEFGDDEWKAAEMARVIARIPDPATIASYADVGCGSGGVFVGIRDRLVAAGFPIQRAVGYDVMPASAVTARRSDVIFKQADFLGDTESFDLVTLNDVIEHVLAPQRFLEGVCEKARYVALHIPLDDRLSVSVLNGYNFRIGPVGHISFWNQSTALNVLTAAGLMPIWCGLTPGFEAPSGRARAIQRVAWVFRWILWRLSPGLMAKTIGGTSMAVLCRGNRK